MHRAAFDRVLLIGDTDRHVQAAVRDALPMSQVVNVANVFDGIAELATGEFSTVLAAAEPIERRPEAAVRTLRDLTGAGRLVLFGHPTLEPLSRKMLEFGVDDYLVTPAQTNELKQMFVSAPMRIAPNEPLSNGNGVADESDEVESHRAPHVKVSPFAAVPLTDAVLDALVQFPHDPVAGAVRQIAVSLPEPATLKLFKADQTLPEPVEGMTSHGHPVRLGGAVHSQLQLNVSENVPDDEARHFLSQVAHQLGKLATLQERHAQLQKLAITDELTGVYNGRYFRHFLSKILDKAKAMRFPVTLLLFDIDNFKKYNDQFGHSVGDEILKQTSALMKRCVREHDCVARISGDEFAVVFWEKEGPRTPLPSGVAGSGGMPGRPPQTPLQVFQRFRALLNRQEFNGLGAKGQGVLTISGGLAVYPYDAQTAEELYDAADKALMFGSKKAGKNTIFLVGSDEPPRLPPLSVEEL
ncbi:MAG TPA: GGDEF domain-containing protein [Tepidisphaeraceae bacterium]|jgi:GGDEF domain-containing protein|nr:GGDEF domain-containing protein [Tepidisphaeraceae bacterium]